MTPEKTQLVTLLIAIVGAVVGIVGAVLGIINTWAQCQPVARPSEDLARAPIPFGGMDDRLLAPEPMWQQ